MAKRAILVVGGTGYGKTTLLQALSGVPIHYRKTQALEFSAIAIDLPGEFCQKPGYYGALVTSALDAEAIWVLQDATASMAGLWPEVLTQMRRPNQPVRGVITKVGHPAADQYRAGRLLETLGVSPPYYPVSALTGRGLSALRALPEIARHLQAAAGEQL